MIQVGFYSLNAIGNETRLAIGHEITFSKILKEIVIMDLKGPIRDPELEEKLRDKIPTDADERTSKSQILKEICRHTGLCVSYVDSDTYELCTESDRNSIPSPDLAP